MKIFSARWVALAGIMLVTASQADAASQRFEACMLKAERMTEVAENSMEAGVTRNANSALLGGALSVRQPWLRAHLRSAEPFPGMPDALLPAPWRAAVYVCDDLSCRSQTNRLFYRARLQAEQCMRIADEEE